MARSHPAVSVTLKQAAVMWSSAPPGVYEIAGEIRGRRRKEKKRTERNPYRTNL
jgi:hypothetical protein